MPLAKVRRPVRAPQAEIRLAPAKCVGLTPVEFRVRLIDKYGRPIHAETGGDILALVEECRRIAAEQGLGTPRILFATRGTTDALQSARQGVKA
jgi:hypothetical protein